MRNIKIVIKNSAFFRVFNLHEEKARGRSAMIASAVIASIAANLTGGVFYSGFLVGYGINLVNIGILSFVPYMASLFCLLSPLVLERFKKRKWVLAGGRILYYTINILGLTLLPQLVKDPSSRIIGFAIIIFLANAVNNIFSQGYSVWHLNFLPEDIRADYFNQSNIINNIMTGAVLIASSAITDALPAGGPEQLRIIVILRFIAYAIAFFDVLVLLLPKEYPYPQTAQKLSPGKVLTLPFKNKKFMLTMLVMFAYTFAANVSAPFINVHLIENVKVSYSLINGINASYFLVFILFGNIAKRQIARWSWFKTYAIWVLIQAPTYLLYTFVHNVDGSLNWLFITVRLMQHVTGLFITLTYSNFPYINLPEADRTAYMSFYVIAVHSSALLSMLFGTGFVKLVGDFSITLFGLALNSVQMLLFMTFVLEAGVSLMVFTLLPKINPENWKEPPKMPRERIMLPWMRKRMIVEEEQKQSS
ncbi:MAG TPA: hypothetical protein PK629_07910 [Oscillospiraceae bacterium]|nr:hypothetical protein [Oscillospiraceae bacterium]HPF56782.1 hypothetical protein [Clostridiales bacterium]HPK35386.1 hypothetical protein [Oscillospiraceae bacterium]HPR75321.1 hypothetical protein [Oscillospiraceae bacterium]